MQHASQSALIASDEAAEVPGLRAPHVLAAMIALIGADNLLLLRFVGVMSPILWTAATAALAALLFAIVRAADDTLIPARRLAKSLLIGIVVMALGGEGRMFYANADWIIRYTVLADMARAPWPFAYTDAAGPEILRAPIGMYLLPALAGKLGTASAMDLVLLGQNGMMLGGLLAVGSTLFSTPRARCIALAILLSFSGMDTIGQMLADPTRLLPLDAHIEGWANSLQYSSNLALAFWVPQHALVGWLGALLFLLWRSGRLPLSHFLAIVPVTLLWSPLGVMGTLPFAAYAGAETVIRREMKPIDILLPLLALVLAWAPITYLQSSAGKVGFHLTFPDPRLYLVFILLEVAPFLIAVWSLGRGGRIGRGAFMAVTACLLLFPFMMVGANADFVMRASIAPLAILAVLVADLFCGPRLPKNAGLLLAVMAIGALTPAREVLRAVMLRPAPTPHCDMPTAWSRSFPQFGKETYLAPVAALPRAIRPPLFALERPIPSSRCWSEPWAMSRFGR